MNTPTTFISGEEGLKSFGSAIIFLNIKLRLAIECKSLDSNEFNINKDNIGALKLQRNQYKNKECDGVGQIRAYCENFDNFQEKFTIPILTNGYGWVVFSKKFLEKLEEPITKGQILFNSNIRDDNFIVSFKDILRKEYHF